MDLYTIYGPGAVETRIGTKFFSNFLRSLEDTLGDYCVLDFRLLGTPQICCLQKVLVQLNILKEKSGYILGQFPLGDLKVQSLSMCSACYRTGAVG